jgi:hypothetical protein
MNNVNTQWIHVRLGRASCSNPSLLSTTVKVLAGYTVARPLGVVPVVMYTPCSAIPKSPRMH